MFCVSGFISIVLSFFFFKKSFKNPNTMANKGTAKTAPKNPHIFAPTTKAIKTKAGEMPIIFFDNAGVRKLPSIC